MSTTTTDSAVSDPRDTAVQDATTNMPVTASSPAVGDQQSSGEQSVWIPVVKFVVGIVVILVALTFSEHISGPIGDFGYVPVMFLYVVVMIIGGGLMVSGFMALWKRMASGSES